MVKKLFSRYWPHLACLLVFLIIASLFFSPLIGGKKVMFQHDIKQAQGMAHEVETFEEETGEQSLWTNSMFGGMPTYQIKAGYPNNWSGYIFSAITYFFGYDRYPITSLWLLMSCFFLMLLAFRVNIWVAAAVSIGYGFTTFNIIGIEAGHANKIWTLMYSPLLLAGVKLAFDKKYLAGASLAAFAMAINVYANHYQISYYLFLVVLVWMMVKLIFAIRDKELKTFVTAALVLLGGVTIGVATNASTLWTTYEYGEESTRGGTDLTIDSTASKDGLDPGYIFDDYSYGNAEVLTFLIPNFSGGASTMDIDKKSELARTIQRSDNMPTYWGDQRYVAGPYYLGAILIFLMILGIWVSRRRSTKIWLILSGCLALFLSMGDNFFLARLFYDYVPLFNKFRTPTMITAITQIAVAMLAAIGLHELWQSKSDPGILKKLNYSFYISGGLCLFLAILGPSLFDFSSNMDEQYGIKGQALELFQEYRIKMMRNDAFRSLVFIALAWAALWALMKEKIKAPLAIGILALLMLSDQWMVNKRYMAEDTYKRKMKNESLFSPSTADQQILQDKALDYRVFNMSLSAFNDATTSYYHKSIGGYHGAKLRRYQELIQYQITPEVQKLSTAINNRDLMLLDSLMRTGMPVMNMLNTRYFIINPDGAPLRNDHANGNAWFIRDLKWVDSADQEILELSTINTKETALIDKSRWEEKVSGVKAGNGEGSITLDSYAPNHLVYTSNSTSDQVAVFSEIYYPKGWTVTIDGQESDYFRVNFVLRAMKVPAGNHTIEFRFDPASYYVGEKISLAGSVLLVLISLAGLGMGVKEAAEKEEKASGEE